MAQTSPMMSDYMEVHINHRHWGLCHRAIDMLPNDVLISDQPPDPRSRTSADDLAQKAVEKAV